MALDFPSNPTNGQIYGNYYYDAATASWRSNPLVSGSAFISDNAPAVSPSGSIWYNSNDGTMFIRYGEQWVEARSNQKITPGSIVQVVSTTKTDTFGSNSTTGVDITGLSATIMPKFANSKIMVTSNVVLGGDTGANVYVRLLRGSTLIGAGNANGSKIQSSGLFRSPDGYATANVAFSYLDSPATTSELTYKIQGLSNVNINWWVNRNHLFQDNSNTPLTSSTISLMEVAQ